jgi:hypothetical protein
VVIETTDEVDGLGDDNRASQRNKADCSNANSGRG